MGQTLASPDRIQKKKDCILKLVIFTQTYPSISSPEQTFIGRELPYLSQHFDKITIIPQKSSGKQLALPNNVSVEYQFSVFYKKQGILSIILNALLSSYFYKELRQRPSIFLHPQMFLRLIKFVGDAELTKKWTINWLKEEGVNTKDTLFYSYWFTQIAMGLGLLKEHFSNMKIISRAHGYDVYEERYTPPYWPLRHQALGDLNKLFLISQNAKKYIQNRYPNFSDKLIVARLGVEKPNFITTSSSDNIFRIVSCSSIVPLKRIELLLEGVAKSADQRPNRFFEWHHFGGGKEKELLQEKAKKLFPSNAKGILLGFLPNERILAFYKENPIDIFINVSETEGVPVSIMEAISCGIPIIATNVGGNPEIVSDKNGILLKQNPTPTEIAHAFFEIIDNPDLALEKRKGSLKVWSEKYDASKNFSNFAHQIASLMDK